MERAKIAVGTKPGHTQLTRIMSAASSTAAICASWISAPFDSEYSAGA